MKLAFLMHHHHASFATDISKIHNPEQYKLYGMFNRVSWDALHTVFPRNNTSFFAEPPFITEDFSMETLQTIVERVIAEHSQEDEEVEVIFISGAEHDTVVCGRLNEKYNKKFKATETIPNYDRFNDKIVMKNILEQTNVRLPKYRKFNKAAYHANPAQYLAEIEQFLMDTGSQNSYPMFVKPINENGSRGTEKIENAEQLRRWAEEITVSADHYEYEVDEFIEGTLYHCDSFIQNGQILYTQVSEDLFPCYDFMCGKPEGSIVLQENDLVHTQLRAFTANALEKLGLPQNGITHLEVFRKASGEIVFLEVAFRPGGAVIPAMYDKYLGRDIRADHLLLQLDSSYKIEIKQGDYAAWVSFPLKKGVVMQCNNPDLLSDKKDKWKVKVGHRENNDLKSIADEAYHVFFWNRDITKLRADFEKLRDFQPVTVNNNEILDTSVARKISFSGGYQTMRTASAPNGASPDMVFPPITENGADSSIHGADLLIPSPSFKPGFSATTSTAK